MGQEGEPVGPETPAEETVGSSGLNSDFMCSGALYGGLEVGGNPPNMSVPGPQSE